MSTAHLPRVLNDLQRPPGLLKADYTDFLVEEQPLYPASGTGSHTYFLLEKAGLTTRQAIHDVAAALGVHRGEIGFAGLKDARAVTRQWMSVEHVEPARLKELDLPRIIIREVTRHTNKLRLGHLRGNHFTIRVRQTEPDRLAELQDGLVTLTQRGVPNYFGPQRFGGRGDTWAIGRALLVNDIDAAMDLILGRPGPADHGGVRHARELYDGGHYQQAVRHWPGMFREQRRALQTLARTKGHKRRAFGTIDKRTRQFYVSAYQSYLFNAVAARRMEHGLDQLLNGDLAWLHRNGAVFHVPDAAAEQARATAFEISPTGPLYGPRMTMPTDQPAEMEAEVLAGDGLTMDHFAQAKVRVAGGRRPLRFQPEDANIRLGADGRGAYLEFTFTLMRGCYATALLRELFEESATEDATLDDSGDAAEY